MKLLSKIYTGLYNNPVFWSFICGIIYSVSFFNGYLFIFAYIGLILFFYRFFQQDALEKPFRNSFAFFMGFYLLLYTWFIELYPFNGFDISKTQGIFILILAVIGISLIHSTETSLIFLFSKLFRKNKYILPVGFAFLFILSEWFMSLGPLGFAWGTVSISQHRFLPVAINASLLGSYFITFLVVCCTGYIALFIIYGTKKLLRTASLLLVLPIISGTVLLLIPEKNEKSINTAIIQGNIASMDKWEDDNITQIYDLYYNLTREAAASGSDIVILPESAIPSSFRTGGRIHNDFAGIAIEFDCTIIMGVLTLAGSKKQNSIIMIDSEGNVSEPYHKQHLVPFGEYLPYEAFFKRFLPFFGNINLDGSSYIPGDASALFDYDGSDIGSLVCFDSIFPGLARKSVSDGAELIIVCTNDSWYKDSAGVYQHLGHSVMRAIENGRYIARAANTGVSCYITSKGRVTKETEPLVADILYETVNTSSSRTLYSYVGDIPLYAAFAFVLIFIIIKLKEKITNGNYKSSSKEVI